MPVISKPDLPSSIVRWIGETQTQVAPSTNQIVAVPITHDWGPLGTDSEEGGVLAVTAQAFEAVFGDGDTPGRDAVLGALDGLGLPGAGGAGGVVAHRMATAAKAKAAKQLQNTTPANALTLTAIYHGTRGNDLAAVVEDDPADAAKDRIRITLGGVTVETYRYAQTDVAALAAAINGRPSRWVTAASLVSGVALTHGTFALVGGNDGAAVTATEIQLALDALEFADFGIFAPMALVDSAVKVQIQTWINQLAEAMRPVRWVSGGDTDETVEDAIAELVANPALRSEHHVRFGVGTWHDSLLDKDLSTAELAPRVAGILAARGVRSALTRAEAARLTPVGSTGPTTEELVAGRDAGVTMLRRVSSANTKVAVSQGVTTFIDSTVEEMPLILFSEPRIVGLLDDFLRGMAVWGDETIIGDVTVTDDTRGLVRKELLKRIEALESSGLATPGTGYAIVEDPHDPALRDSIPYEFGFEVAQTANNLIGQGHVR